MPTLSLSNSVAYSGLEGAGLDPVKVFPPIRTLGSIGFICMMWFVDLMGYQQNYNQFFVCGVVGLLFGAYALTLPPCPVSNDGGSSAAGKSCMGQGVWIRNGGHRKAGRKSGRI